MPFWRPLPLTSVTESDGNPKSSSSFRMGSNDSWRMNASTFFTAGHDNSWSGAWRHHPGRLQTKPELLPVLAPERVQPRQPPAPVGGVRDGMPVHEDGARRGHGGAVVLEPGRERVDELRAVLLVVP